MFSTAKRVVVKWDRINPAVQGKEASCLTHNATKRVAEQCLANLKLKLVTDAVTVSCVNAIDWEADSLRSLNVRTINPATVSPATMLNS